MSDLEASDFRAFFLELHDYAPFPWQERLAAQVCNGGAWPKTIDLPTASGKTACIDIAVFSLAVSGAEMPRRIFFVVDRRVIVNEAYERAARISEKLKRATDGLLKQVADRLKTLGGQNTALDVYQLRGGAYRDETWVRSPLQPTVVTSTVDQVGSRLLFRGYGVRPESWPIHAGLIANDALIFLDEAHCSKAFASTLEAVDAYRGGKWARSPIGRPFAFVEMTATPGRQTRDNERFCTDEADRENEVFGKRLRARKQVRIAEPVKCRKEDIGKFAKALLEHANDLAKACDARRIAILVNRVLTAKALYQELQKQDKQVHLVTGRMRPLDRDKQAEELKGLKSGAPRDAGGPIRYVVSTQCLEVGADLDFDVLVSECASIDALLQRFGRLDRTGAFGKATGAIVSATWQLTGKEGDPVYRDSLKETWNYLAGLASSSVVEMGIESTRDSPKTVVERLRELNDEQRDKMRLAVTPGPRLLPSHLDAFAQTSPEPAQQPDVELFLHGKKGNPDVNIVWRGDLNDFNVRDWPGVIALCPPSSLEAMPVPIGNFRKWFAGEVQKEAFSDESDLEVVAAVSELGADVNRDASLPDAVIWRGTDEHISKPRLRDFRPGDVIVLADASQSWNELGHIPDGYDIDIGDVARLQLRRAITLRLHPGVSKVEAAEVLRSLLSTEQSQIDEEVVRSAVREINPPIQLLPPNQDRDWWSTFVNNCTISEYPGGAGWVLDGYFERAKKGKSSMVTLKQHLEDVVEETSKLVDGAVSPDILEALRCAATYHDYGKADIRYQTWLRNGDRMAAELAPCPIAKSGTYVLKKQTECGLPASFRHELLSLLLADKSEALAATPLRNLVLHLIAAHHGYCRPFAPVVLDTEASCLEVQGLKLCRQERRQKAAHLLGSGVSDRFWALTRQYGWWGLAYLEAILRLADWHASEKEQVEGGDVN